MGPSRPPRCWAGSAPLAPSPGADTLRDPARRLKILLALVAPVTSAAPRHRDRDRAERLRRGNGRRRGLRVLEVASEGRARMDAASWVRGAHLEPGERLG